MSWLDGFTEEQIQVTLRSKIANDDPADGDWEADETITDIGPLYGVKYNRALAERYFESTWAAEVTDVFVTDNINGATGNDFLIFNGLEYAIEGITDVAAQGEVFLIGMKVQK